MAIPKGIRSRLTPDWFALYLSQGGFGNPPGGLVSLEYQAISLWNNTTTGALLYVWGLSGILSDADYFLVGYREQPLGALQGDCVRINPQVGAPPGQIYWLHNGASPIPLTPFGIVTGFGSTGGQASYPAYVIPPNQALVFATPVRADEVALNAWFIPMKDPKGTQPV